MEKRARKQARGGKSDTAKPAAKAAKKKPPVAHAPGPAERAASRA
jgi:hypothetical protein